MRPFLLTFLLALLLSDVHAAATAAMVGAPHPAVVADCRVTVSRTASRFPEPPAWLLLAGAVVALGAGRVAAR